MFEQQVAAFSYLETVFRILKGAPKALLKRIWLGFSIGMKNVEQDHLDLIRLGEGRWLARAVTRFDGTMIVLEEVLECDGLPHVEAVIDVEVEPARLIIRHRDAPSIVLAERQLEMTITAN